MKTTDKFVAILLTCVVGVLLLFLFSNGDGNGVILNNTSNQSCTHKSELIEGVKATCTESGMSYGRKCSICGEILEQPLRAEALGHTTDCGTCERCGKVIGIWENSCYVDKFNQPTPAEQIIVNNSPLQGTFSNSATTDSDLTVKIIYDYKERIAFFLYEYGYSLVKNASTTSNKPYTIIMRTQDGKDHNMTGKILRGSDRVILDKTYNDVVIEALKSEGDIKFYFEESERTISTYLFTVPTANFKDAFLKMDEILNKN